MGRAIAVDEREALHQLVDRLSDSELPTARRSLQHLSATGRAMLIAERTIVVRLTVEGGEPPQRLASALPSEATSDVDQAATAALPSAPPTVSADGRSSEQGPPPCARRHWSQVVGLVGWGILLLLIVAMTATVVGMMVAPVIGGPPELRRVPLADQGVDYEHPLLPGVYPLWELSTRRHIVDSGRPVYVDDRGQRVVLPERGSVPVDDQMIDRAHPLQPGVYPLRQWSTGLQIVENGELIYVDTDGHRVPPGQLGR